MPTCPRSRVAEPALISGAAPWCWSCARAAGWGLCCLLPQTHCRTAIAAATRRPRLLYFLFALQAAASLACLCTGALCRCPQELRQCRAWLQVGRNNHCGLLQIVTATDCLVQCRILCANMNITVYKRNRNDSAEGGMRACCRYTLWYHVLTCFGHKQSSP
jgi:hypothetical protein